MVIDPLMTNAETSAFRHALTTETNPNHLFGFASALAPDHCAAASVLHGRATLLEQRRLVGPDMLDQLLTTLYMLALESRPPYAPPPVLNASRRQLEALAMSLRAPGSLLYRKTRQTAGEMVVDDNANFANVPHAVVSAARLLIIPVGTIRVLDPGAVRIMLPPTVHLTSRAEADDRARWIRHYAREMRLHA